MSLIHWWPLNGDLKDKINHIPLSGPWEVSTNGKVGSCYGTNDGEIITATVTIPNTFSIAFWAKNNDLTYPKTTAPIQFSEKAISTTNAGWDYAHRANGTAPDNTNYRVTLSDGVHALANFYWNRAGGNPLDLLNQWYHVAITVDNEKRKINLYINGVSYGEQNIPSDFNGCGGTRKLIIGRVQGWKLDGYMNDVRIYDHALSLAEVKELSKALVVHYTFDDNLIEKTDNRSRAKDWGTFDSYWYLSKEKEIYKLVKSEKSATETTVALSNSSLLKEMQVGEIWTVSCYLYKEGNPYKTSETSISPYTWQITGIKSESREDGYFSCTFRVDSKNGAFIIHSRLFGDSTTNPVGTKCEIRYLQFEKRDYATVFTSSVREGVLHNEVGYIQPNATELKNVTTTKDATIGSSALTCNETAIVTPLVADIDQGVTISCWVKVLEYPTSPKHNPNQVVFADTNSKLAFGFYNNTEAIISCASYPAAKITNFQEAWMGKNNALEKEWHHIVVTRDKEGTIKCWLNGLELTERGASNNWSQNKDALIIGTRYNGSYGPYFSGYIDDFRVYQTLLNENDILDLYKTKGYISNCGDMVCNEFVQEENEFLLNENSEAIAKNFVEHIPDGYEFIEYIANDDNKQYIDTGYYWHNEKATILADLEVTSNSGNQSLFGNEEVVGANSSRYFAHILHGKNGSFSNYIGKSAAGVTSIPLNTRMKVEYAAHGDNTFSIETKKVATGETTTYNGTYSGSILTRQNTITNNGVTNLGHIFIFANHNSASGSGAIQQVGGMKLYGFIMIDNNECVRDFRPCRRIKDSVVGLFDMIEGKFYTTPVSAFVAGEVVSTDTSFQVLSDSTVYANQLIEI